MTAYPRVQPLLNLVGALVTRFAVELKGAPERDQAVFHGFMTLDAFDVVFGDVRSVYELGIVGLVESLGFVVAVEATCFVCFPRSLYHRIVTRHA